jgi:hypothetical protein
MNIGAFLFWACFCTLIVACLRSASTLTRGVHSELPRSWVTPATDAQMKRRTNAIGLLTLIGIVALCAYLLSAHS